MRESNIPGGGGGKMRGRDITKGKRERKGKTMTSKRDKVYGSKGNGRQ